MEVELEQKEEKIQNLLQNCVGAPDERFEEKEVRIVELEEKVENLEKENFRVKEEAKSQTSFPGKKTGRDENERMIKDLSK